MALKSIMIAKKLELKRAAFEALVAKDAEFATRSAEIEKQSAKLPPMRSSRLLRTP